MKSVNYLYNISRYCLGALFIFSGVAKSINPFGLSIQLGEYFTALGLEVLRPASAVGAIAMCAAELLLGLLLVTGLWRRAAAWVTVAAMTFFTSLTLWIALENPVSDCGCFGDLLKLSNWATFWKNIAFLPFTIVLWRGRNRQSEQKRAWYVWLLVPVSCFLAVYCYYGLPLLDATPFKVGVNIPAAMSIPDGAPRAEYHTTLIYRNLVSGKEREFEIDDTTWQDQSQWQFVDSKIHAITQGYEPPIKSMPMIESGMDVSSEVLGDVTPLLIFVTTEPDVLDLTLLESLVRKMRALGGRAILLSSSQREGQSLDGLRELLGDYTLIRTMIQNYRGGALLIENGTIQHKWAMSQLSDKTELNRCL